MFRVALSRLAATGRQRNFVSSVLLTRTWENESVADLKREAKIRGLSPYVLLVLMFELPLMNLYLKGEGTKLA